MTGILIFLAAVAVLTLGPRYGVDSRDGRDWQRGMWAPGPARRRHRLSDDVRLIARRIRAAHRRQVDLHERYLERQRPWANRWLHWRGRRLMGRLLPEEAKKEDRTGVR
ncbi:MAG TPA: hypothetical protein VHC49_24425 [Mycobacteriales bacterium]|nr:hypothetical protein [Mycobacteriales bacterium]